MSINDETFGVFKSVNAFHIIHMTRRIRQIDDTIASDNVDNCGNCRFWMTNNCPREYDLHMYSRIRTVTMFENPCVAYDTSHKKEIHDKLRIEKASLEEQLVEAKLMSE